MVWVAVFSLEGASMGVLMAFHFVNFRSGSLLASHKDKEPAYASIKLGEYYFFTNEEVDAHSLADDSDYALDDSVDADSNVKERPNPLKPVLNATTESRGTNSMLSSID